MARFDLTATAPPGGFRESGVAVSRTAAGDHAQAWHYPTSSPSARFALTNAQVIALDAAYDALPQETRDAWDGWAVELPWGLYLDCDLEVV